MRKNKKRKGLNTAPIRCPYCGSHAVLKSADGIYKDNSKNMMLYVCSRYPKCDAYVRCHAGTTIPVGSMANHELRALRKTAHDYFDKLHKSGLMTKEDAYHWLAATVDAPMKHAHIGHLSEYYCKKVIDKSKEYFERYHSKIKLHKGGLAS